MSIKSSIDLKLREMGQYAPKGFFIGLHIRFTAPLMTFQTYDSDWIDYYTDNGFVLRDPMTAWGFSTTGTIRWSDPRLPDPFDLFGEARKFGLKYGVTISHGPIRSRTIASFSRADREFTHPEIVALEVLVKDLHEMTEAPIELSKAQVEALRCVAAGDRHAAAAAKLGISESALKARLISVREKLMARTTAEAIQRAKDLRLL